MGDEAFGDRVLHMTPKGVACAFAGVAAHKFGPDMLALDDADFWSIEKWMRHEAEREQRLAEGASEGVQLLRPDLRSFRLCV